MSNVWAIVDAGTHATRRSRHSLHGTRTIEDVIRRVLCLGGGVDQKPAIIAKLLQ
jgi:hypothetical protein